MMYSQVHDMSKKARVMINDVRLQVRVPRELYQEVMAKARAEDVNLSQLVRWALRAWLRGDIPTGVRFKPERDVTSQGE